MERTFTFRLCSGHAAADCSTQSLELDMLGEAGDWLPQLPSVTLPGFRLYLLSLLLCLHYALVVNARERGFRLKRVEGRFDVFCVDWKLQQYVATFDLGLEPAAVDSADAGSLASIAESMKLCPVSRNLSAGVDKQITLQVRPCLEL